MERINPAFFYSIGAALGPLTKLEYTRETRLNIYFTSLTVEPLLRSLLNFFSALTVCRRKAIELITAIEEEKKWIIKTPFAEVGEENFEVDTMFRKVIDVAKELQSPLYEELQTLDTYHASQKGIYSTIGLIESAEKVLPESVLEKIDEQVIDEIRQSGRCLVFDVATASAFHIMRATELVLYKYYLQVCKPQKKKRLDNWGQYISKLSQSQDTGVKEVVALLQQIKDQHRNLIMHPEVILKPDEAFMLFEIAQSVIIAMANALPKLKKKK